MTAIAALLLPPRMASAEPLGGTVVGGAAGISQAGSVTNINQSSNKAIINWQSFSVAPQETVNFNQPSSASVTLNRVIGNESSVISGALNANGQIFIVNSAGVLFGKGAQVNVGGLVASTRDISNADFMAGNYTFSGSSSAAVVNQGRIRAAQGGYVALLGKTVSNDGVISARLGTVTMAAGDKITLNFGGNSLLDVTIDQGTLNGLVENKRAIRADGGQVIMTAKAADAVLSAQVNNSGIVQARTVSALKGGAVNSGTARTGKIKLLADGGTTRVSGKLDASAPKGGNGGTIETSGNKVAIADSATITTLAANGKSGTWLIDPDGYTIAASGGDITGAALSNRLATNGSVIIHSTDGHGADGNINVNDAVSWSANTLTLNATNNIYVNAVMTATGTASFTGQYGVGTNTDGTPMGIYMAQGRNADGTNNGTFTGRLDFSGTGTLILHGDVYTVIHSLSDLYTITTNDSFSNPTSDMTLPGYLIANGHYALGSNLNAAGYDTAVNYNSAGYAVIPALSGVLDGLGHTVSNLNINGPTVSFNGLVADNFGGTIRNVGMVNTIVNGQRITGTLVGINEGGAIVNTFAAGGTVVGNRGDTVGGLVGSNQGLIANSWANLSVTGVKTVGGLVGDNTIDYFLPSGIPYVGTIIGSYATGSVNAFPNGAVARTAFGGLVGQNNGGIIKNSYAAGVVLSPSLSNGTTILNSSEGNGDLNMVGGLVGYNRNDSSGVVATISDSYATGNVFSPGQYIGGLVGQNSGGNIDGSHATGTVTATISGVGYIGGLVGANTGLSSQITNSYATGDVIAPNANFVGGIAGISSGLIRNVQYSMGTVYGGSNVGGIVGQNLGTVDNATNSGNVTGYSSVGGIAGTNSTGTLTTAAINNSSSSGTIRGDNLVGGITGYNAGALAGNSVTGSIFGRTDVGGLAGYNAAPQSNAAGGTMNGNTFAGSVTGGTDTGVSLTVGTNQNTDPNAIRNQSGSGTLSTPASRAQAAADAAARQTAAAERAATAVRTANVSATNAGTSAATPPDAAMSAAGKLAATSPSSSKLNDEFKSLDEKVRDDDARERRQIAASAVSRNARRSGAGRAGSGLGATIRSIDIDGQHFDLRNNPTKKGAGP